MLFILAFAEHPYHWRRVPAPPVLGQSGGEARAAEVYGRAPKSRLAGPASSVTIITSQLVDTYIEWLNIQHAGSSICAWKP